MEKTLAERAEEARLEEENHSQERCNAWIAEDTQKIVDYFREKFPEAAYLGDRKFQLGDEVLIGTIEHHLCYNKDGKLQDGPLYYLATGPRYSYDYYCFNDLAGYGRYLHNKSLRSKEVAIEENRPQQKESWFTNFINWAKRYGK